LNSFNPIIIHNNDFGGGKTLIQVGFHNCWKGKKKGFVNFSGRKQEGLINSSGKRKFEFKSFLFNNQISKNKRS